MRRISLLLSLALLFTFATPARAQSPAPPDGPATLVKDINTGTQSAMPFALTAVGSQLFFTANDGIHGSELWVSAGPAGARMVSDIWPGSNSSGPTQLTDLNGTLFFTADDGVHGNELWRSDGTAAGTNLVKDITPGADSTSEYPLTPVGNALFFMAASTTNQTTLWKTDGTPEGTVPLKSGFEPVGGIAKETSTAVGNTLFFFTESPIDGFHLWKSDGTSDGTSEVMRIKKPASTTFHMPQIGGNPPTPGLLWAANLNGTLLFLVTEDGVTYTLWRSDGTAAGTKTVREVPDSYGPILAAGRLFFRATAELWVSDGTTAGTQMVRSFDENGQPRAITSLVAARGAVFLLVGGTQTDLWKSDGTAAGTQLVTSIGPTTFTNDSGVGLTNVDDVLFFPANDPQTGRELWRSDGTAAGTSLVKDIFPEADSNPKNLTNVNGRLFFVASDPRSADELWTSDGTEQGTQLVQDINTSPLSSAPEVMGQVHGTLLFAADDGVHGRELWKSDGSAGGTTLVKDIAPGPASSIPDTIVATLFHDDLFFATYSDQAGSTLWRTDGTAAGTVALKNFVAPDVTSSGIYALLVAGDTLFFTYSSTLWRSDGTAVGTTQVAEIGYGVDNQHAVDLHGTLVFADGCGIWKSDGTPTGTVRVKAFDDPCGGLQSLVVAGDSVYFVYRASPYNCMQSLWKSDGTEAGTVLIKTVADPSQCFSASLLVNVGATIFFTVGASSNGDGALWRSDGTEAGTRPINQSPGLIFDFTVVGNQLFFVLTHLGILELWGSDGTADGTHSVVTLGSGIPPGRDVSLAHIGNTLLLGVPDASGRYAVYRSDGTEAGTQRVQSFTPTSFPPDDDHLPRDFTVAGSHLFFSADGGAGQELWAIPTSDGIATTLRSAPTLYARPGGTLTIPARYDNSGFTATTGLTLTATLDPALTYLDASGSPTVDGATLTWHLPDLSFLASGTQQVRVTLPDAPLGTRYTVTWTLDAPGDTTPDDNTHTAEILVAQPTFLPLVGR